MPLLRNHWLFLSTIRRANSKFLTCPQCVGSTTIRVCALPSAAHMLQCADTIPFDASSGIHVNAPLVS